MKKKDISYDSNETDVKELQRMIDEMDSLINDAETRTTDIKDLLDIKHIGEISNIETAYDQAKELADDLY